MNEQCQVQHLHSIPITFLNVLNELAALRHTFFSKPCQASSTILLKGRTYFEFQRLEKVRTSTWGYAESGRAKGLLKSSLALSQRSMASTVISTLALATPGCCFAQSSVGFTKTMLGTTNVR